MAGRRQQQHHQMTEQLIPPLKNRFGENPAAGKFAGDRKTATELAGGFRRAVATGGNWVVVARGRGIKGWWQAMVGDRRGGSIERGDVGGYGAFAFDIWKESPYFIEIGVLPVMIDVGTNNEKLLNDPLYLGLQERRLDGDEYISVIDEFMEAVFTRWSNVVVQFEDFQSKWAFRLLQRYRENYRMFNDDVQVQHFGKCPVRHAGGAAIGLGGLVGVADSTIILQPCQYAQEAAGGAALAGWATRCR
ncbi:hypothetical protein Cgig2_033243 [Carnegiea gigantea]|uniref:Malic enzyme N-terminal domain-containing protein n=1 Tax=Carnegiea gigantea TaxID=171969 RepID=A0A9Q1KUQ1_9CARY|nr:hypothetical protein Cgig2_033243 [Carnegiea gigantea]